MKIYPTKAQLYNDLPIYEIGTTVIAMPKFSEEDGELLGYYKYYVD